VCLAGALVFTVAEEKKAVIRLFNRKPLRSTAGPDARSGSLTTQGQT
jgi:hypothetical protein